MDDACTLRAAVLGVAAKTEELAREVHLADLFAAVREQNLRLVAKSGAECARFGVIDRRCGPHRGAGCFALSAPPLWLAVYQGQQAVVEALLGTGAADPNARAQSCAGVGCALGGRTALHMAIARQHSGPSCGASVVRQLLELGASPDLAMCFSVSADDEPEWDEERGEFTGGLAGLTALQLAAQRSDASACEALLAHGADTDRAPLPASDLLAPVRNDGEEVTCPICLVEVLQLTAAFTPCCVRAFHGYCLRGCDKCPLCRSPMLRRQ